MVEEGEDDLVAMVTYDTRDNGEFPGVSSPITLLIRPHFLSPKGVHIWAVSIVSLTKTGE